MGIHTIYHGTSSVKFCSCDDDNKGCSLTDEDIVNDSDSTENGSSLTVKITFSIFVTSVAGLLMINF